MSIKRLPPAAPPNNVPQSIAPSVVLLNAGRTLAGVCMALLAVGGPRHSSAADIEPRAGISGIYSDNIQRSNTGRIEGGAAGATLGVRVDQAGPRFSADADMQVLFLKFFADDLGSRTLPAGTAHGSLILIPDRFTWTAEDSVGQISSQPLDILQTNDQENVNYFSTGPDFYLPFGGRNRLQLSGRYAVANYQDSLIDSDRFRGQARISRELNSRATLSAVLDVGRLQYKEDFFPTVDQQSAYASYSLDSGRTFLVGEGGVERIRLSSTQEWHSAPHVQLLLQRRISPRLTLNAEYRRGFSDAGQDFRNLSQDQLSSGSSQVVQRVADPFRSDQAYIMLVRSAGRALLSAEVTWDRQQYQELSQFDRRDIGADIAIEYQLSPVLSADARLRTYRETFLNSLGSQHRSEGSIGLTDRLSRVLNLNLTYLRGEGGGDFASDRFDENRVVLRDRKSVV